MILKGSQRGGGQNLAVHLMRVDDNEHMRVHELRGFAADDLRGAFKEAEAISLGTKCRQYLFSLSLNPPADQNLPPEAFEAAIGTIEHRLGLEGQPRAIVFHEKEGRRHAHCVWSRIDAETMTARPMSFFKTKLMAASRDLYLDHGWDMPRGMIDAARRDPTNFTLAEWQEAKRKGVDPRWTKQVVQDCWSRSDSRPAFERALQEHGFFLARGDRRGFVLVDHDGSVHSLSRALSVNAKDVRARLGEGDGLRGVSDTQQVVGERMSPAIRRHIAESRERFRDRSAELGRQKEAMTKAHRQERALLAERQTAEWTQETKQRAERLPRGLRGLWHRLTGQYQEVRRRNEAEAQSTINRHATERWQLLQRQHEQRAPLQARFKELRKSQAALLFDLRRDVGRYLRLAQRRDAEGPDRTQGQGRQRSLRLER
jgi:hypothetical protein